MATITSGDAIGVQGAVFSYQITTSASATLYAATTLPAGLTLDTATGIISGAPTAAALTSVSLTATVDGIAISEPRQFRIVTPGSLVIPDSVLTVDVVTRALTLSSPLTFAHGTTVLLQVEFSPTESVGYVTNVGIYIKESGSLGLLQQGLVLATANVSNAIIGSAGTRFALPSFVISSGPLNTSLTLMDLIAPTLQKDFQLEVHWDWNGRHRTSAIVPCTVTRELQLASYDSAPPIPGGSYTGGTWQYLPSITGYTGGGPTKLDGQDALTPPLHFLAIFVVAGTGTQTARLELTSEPRDGALEITPALNDPTTPRVWRVRS